MDVTVYSDMHIDQEKSQYVILCYIMIVYLFVFVVFRRKFHIDSILIIILYGFSNMCRWQKVYSLYVVIGIYYNIVQPVWDTEQMQWTK